MSRNNCDSFDCFSEKKTASPCIIIFLEKIAVDNWIVDCNSEDIAVSFGNFAVLFAEGYCQNEFEAEFSCCLDSFELVEIQLGQLYFREYV